MAAVVFLADGGIVGELTGATPEPIAERITHGDGLGHGDLTLPHASARPPSRECAPANDCRPSRKECNG